MSSAIGAPSAALQAIGNRPRRPQRRPTKQASYELANHAKAYLEGGQFASGFDFLCSLLTAGISISTPAQPYIGYLAPPAFVAFAASVVVDPKFSTKSQSSEASKGSDAALRYLQCVHVTVDGPAYPTIRAAFRFPEERRRRRAPGHRSAAGSMSPHLGGDVERISGEDANERSLWHSAEDFWHIVGWAFNCSVVYKKRWERWKLWLVTMLDFLESDWDYCVQRSKDDAAERETILQESVIFHYIVGDTTTANRGARRRMVKAILAMATAESHREFPEIWEKETAQLKRTKREEQPLPEISFETNDLGDYDSDEEMEDASETEVSLHDPRATGVPNMHDALVELGGLDAIDLRQRLIALLAQVTLELPRQFTTLSDFFDNILEEFHQLPTTIFQVLLSTLRIPPRLQIAFHVNLLLPLVSGKVPDYFRFEPLQVHFETRLLALRATTQSFAVNTKISLILEQMLMYMMSQNALTPTNALCQAIETGIEARHSVHGIAKGKRNIPQEENVAKELMEASSERLRGLLELLEIGAGEQLGRSSPHLASTSATGSPLSSPPDSETDPESPSQ